MDEHARRAPGEFSIDVRPDRNRVWVTPEGELDLLTTRQVERRVAELAGAGFAHVVVDLRQLEFIDSTGLRALLRLNWRAQQDGWRLSLVQGGDEVRRVFEITGTLELLPFEDQSLRFSR